jgi:hypothetical protein
MSEAKEFRQYAEEAMRWASESTIEEEKRILIDLACTWPQAAAESETPVMPGNNSSARHPTRV